MRTKTKYVVTRGGKECGYTLRNCFGYKRGLLAPDVGSVAYFGGERSANQAISRTLKVAQRIKGSMLDGWEKVTPITDGGSFTVKPA